ncbi:MAG: hypothetical protein V1821_02460 [bacterium]
MSEVASFESPSAKNININELRLARARLVQEYQTLFLKTQHSKRELERMRVLRYLINKNIEAQKNLKAASQ